MKILLACATNNELNAIAGNLPNSDKEGLYTIENHLIEPFVHGIGIYASIFHLTEKLCTEPYDLILHCGIAGSYQENLPPGEVVMVKHEMFGDNLYITNEFSRTHFEHGLLRHDAPPFIDGTLENTCPYPGHFTYGVKGLTLNQINRTEDFLALIRRKFQPDIETMEGAAVFYVCLKQQQPFIEIRSISNYVEEYDHQHWQIDQALEALNKTTLDYIKQI